MKEKIRKIPSSDTETFVCMTMDHSPQELIKNNCDELTSVVLFIHSNFARELDAYLKKKNFKLRKWSSRGNYKERFINNVFLDNEFQELPFFFRVLKTSNDIIIRSKDHYIRELGIPSYCFEEFDNNERKYHRYRLLPSNIELIDQMSFATLHISHFIARSFIEFKKMCEMSNISCIDDPIQIYHDFFPFESNEMANLVQLFIGNRGINLCHWNEVKVKNREVEDDLLCDNLCGLFRNIDLLEPDIAKQIEHKNKTCLVYERWKNK